MSISAKQMERMLDAVSGYCTGSPEAARRMTINHSVDRFIRDIGGIRQHLGPVAMNHADGIYYAVAPFGGVIFDVRNVCVDGGIVSCDVFKVFYRDDGRASITFSRGNRENNILEFDILWRPGERTTQMPDAWFDKHFDTIMHGSIAAILSQVGTAWGNPILAAQFESEYARDVHDNIYDARVAESMNGHLSAFDNTARWI